MANENDGKEITDKNLKVPGMSEMVEITNERIESVGESDAAQHDDSEEQRLRIAQNKVAARTAIKRSNQPDLADPLVGPSTANMSPGAMQMSAVVKLHSTQSINLFRGRKGDPANGVRPIIGLARFARQVSMVWSASASDDPYADQVLLNVEEAFEAAKAALDSKEKTMTELLEGMEDFEVTLQASVSPVELRLQFYSPWGFRAAMLLKQFDKLVRMGLTARHIGIFTESDWVTIIRDSSRLLRHMFNEVDSWVSTGVKREDIRSNNNAAKRAQARYKELRKNRMKLAEIVVDGQHRAKLSPVNRILERYHGAEPVAQADDQAPNNGRAAKSVSVKTRGPAFGFNIGREMAGVKVKSSESKGGDNMKINNPDDEKSGGKI